mmetsp:Transcript_64036/g.202596  ORF Transcript_64036/g.202596 Transcript_64036/m.202596 type:complete len:158 (+) Transcript_64036:482-955(+)
MTSGARAREDFAAAVAGADMELILQVHTCGYGGRAGQVPTRDISQHLASLKEGMDAARGMGAALANVHSGHDSWGVEEGRKYMLEAANIEAASGILLSHETHRKRLMWNPWNFRDLMLALEGEPVKITADISHWVVCCEVLHSLDSHFPVFFNIPVK